MRVLLAPGRVAERLERSPGRVGVGSGVDRLERGSERFAVGVVHEPHRRPDQVHHAGSDGGFRPGRFDRLGEPGEPVAAHDQDVFDPAVGQVRAHPGPERRSLGGLDPDPEDVFDAVDVDPDRDVGGLVQHVRAVADLDHQRVEIDHRVERLEGTLLPDQDLVGDVVGDLADRFPRQFGPDGGHQVMLDVADRHPARIQADDHVVEATEASGPFRDQPRGERPVPIPRDREVDLADLGLDRFRGVTVPGVHVLGGVG